MHSLPVQITTHSYTPILTFLFYTPSQLLQPSHPPLHPHTPALLFPKPSQLYRSVYTHPCTLIQQSYSFLYPLNSCSLYPHAYTLTHPPYSFLHLLRSLCTPKNPLYSFLHLIRIPYSLFTIPYTLIHPPYSFLRSLRSPTPSIHPFLQILKPNSIFLHSLRSTCSCTPTTTPLHPPFFLLLPLRPLYRRYTHPNTPPQHPLEGRHGWLAG